MSDPDGAAPAPFSINEIDAGRRKRAPSNRIEAGAGAPLSRGIGG
jgi:hypothetical protein